MTETNQWEYRVQTIGAMAEHLQRIVPEARIAITNLATGVSTASTTNAEGAWVAPFLPPGAYSVKEITTGNGHTILSTRACNK